jgi:hypothetical protein
MCWYRSLAFALTMVHLMTTNALNIITRNNAASAKPRKAEKKPAPTARPTAETMCSIRAPSVVATISGACRVLMIRVYRSVMQIATRAIPKAIAIC